MVKVLFITVLLASGLGATPSHGYVKGTSVGNLRTPPPPPTLVATRPPQLFAVPGTPVYYAPGVSFNLFVYSGRYYSLHNGVWFTTAHPGAPWVVIAAEKVPRPLLAVPAKYYKIPPGQAKKVAGEQRGTGQGRRK